MSPDAPVEGIDTLVVDVDGCLIKTDLLYEGVVAAVRRNPFVLFLFPFWLLKGKAHLKTQIASRGEISIESLPYNAAILDLIDQFAKRGSRVILATASHITLAERIARYLGRFACVLATRERNLAGHAKLEAILSHVNGGSFAYVGNANADLAIWARCAGIYVVDPSPGVRPGLRRLEREPTHVFITRQPYLRSLLAALRPHQWLKNVLVFVPLVAAHRLLDGDAWLAALMMFLAYTLTASSVYLVNDLLDLDADRTHPQKRRRPFAAGDLPVLHGLLIAPLLLGLGLVLAFTINIAAGLLILLYAVSSTAYSFLLKRYVVLDVLTLAGLYTLRILAGAAATQITPSFWLLAFSMFFFLSLATMKRVAELHNLAEAGMRSASRRGYMVSDLPTIRTLGITSGYLSVLVLALYVHAPDVAERYARPELLWFLCIVLLYWLGRLWVKTERGLMDEDPVVYAINDWNSWVLGALSAGILFLAAVRS